MRGRSRNKGPNPLTRSYESNGPDVKIRGTAQHVADKYSQLSRDAHASGDPVASENYLQHAEHYYRLIAAAQEQYRQQFGGLQRDEDGEEGDEEPGFGGQPSDRSQGGDEFGDVPAFPQGGQDRHQDRPYERQGQGQNRGDRFDRGDRQNQNRQRFDRNGERYDRGGQGVQGGDRNQERGERFGGGYDRPNGAEQRYDRQGGGERPDRPNGYDRQDRNQERGPDRNQERGPDRSQDRPDRNQDRNQDRRERFARDDRPRDDRGGFPPRDGRRENRPGGYGAEEGREDEREGGADLPAFLTTPVRPAISVDEVAETAGLAPPHAEAEGGEATGIRPRRRRPRKTDQAPEGVDETADGA